MYHKKICEQCFFFSKVISNIEPTTHSPYASVVPSPSFPMPRLVMDLPPTLCNHTVFKTLT